MGRSCLTACHHGQGDFQSRQLIHCHSLGIILPAYSFSSENVVSQGTACAWTFFPKHQWYGKDYSTESFRDNFLENKELSGWLKAQRLEASKRTTAAVWGVEFSALSSKTGRQSALPVRNWMRLLTMLRCGNSSVPDTMAGSIGRIQSRGLAYIFSQVPCLCPQSGTEDPRLLSAPQPEEGE